MRTPSGRSAALVATACAACAAGVLWFVWLVGELTQPLSSVGHHDFFALYAAGSLVRAHSAGSLYDAAALTSVERQIYPHPTGYAGYMPFLNPPPAAALLAPLSLLSFAQARIVWFAISLGIALGCAAVLTHGRDARLRLAGAGAVLVSFPAYQALIEGQWSFVLLLGGLLALLAMRRNHPWLAGAALALLWLKPPLLILVLIWCLLTRRWRVIGGAMIVVIGVTLLALPWTGVDADIAYLKYLGGVSLAHAAGGGASGATTWEGAFANMEGLLGLAAAVVGQQHSLAVDVVAAVAALICIAVFSFAMRGHWRNVPLSLQVSAVCLGLLLDPHLYAQDCVLLIVTAVLVLHRLDRVLPRVALWWKGVSRAQLEAQLLVAVVLVMDLCALDTLWIQGVFPAPLHLFTAALIAAVAIPAYQRWRIRRTSAQLPASASSSRRAAATRR